MALDIDFCEFSMPCGKQQCQSTGSNFNLIGPLNLTCKQVVIGINHTLINLYFLANLLLIKVAKWLIMKMNYPSLPLHYALKFRGREERE